MPASGAPAGRTLWPVAAAGAAAAIATAAILAVAGAGAVAAAVVAGGLLLLVAAVALVGWRGALDRLAGTDAAAAAERARHVAEAEHLRRDARRLEDALAQQGVLLRRVRESWGAEREWARELRRQLHAAHARRARETSAGSVPELILQAAIELVGAEKGLLLTHADEDGDGDLDLAAARGFDADPEHSRVAQRFARAVLERDEIIREDDPAPAGEPHEDADHEIRSLVAIPLFLRDRFHGVIVCANREGGFEDVDEDLLLALGDHAGATLQHGRLHHEIRETQRGTIRALAEAVAARDPVLHRETGRLAVLAGRLGGAIGLDDRETDVLVCATVLRAIGNLAIPERPLMHPGPLSAADRDLVEMHPRLGFNVISQAPALRDVAVTVLYHHERHDGMGYPTGLAGDAIPRTARALAVLEAYGAITHDRPYRPASEPEDALEELRQHAGTQFDPAIVEAFARLVEAMERPPDDALAEALLDILPFDPAEEDGGPAGRLATSSIDGLTLLGNHRALLADATRRAATAGVRGRFAVAMAELSDLPQINLREGYAAGDRTLQRAARAAQRAAARVGGTPYRDSGRRLAIVAPLDDDGLSGLLDELRIEFTMGPAVRVVASPWEPDERGEDVVARARDTLRLR